MENHEPKILGEESRRERRPEADAAPRRIAISELYEEAYRRACHMAESLSGSAAAEPSDALIWAERKRAPRHPGRALREDFLGPRNLTPERLSAATGIAPERLASLLAEREPVCANVAAALARFFGGRPTFWLELQAHYDQ